MTACIKGSCIYPSFCTLAIARLTLSCLVFRRLVIQHEPVTADEPRYLATENEGVPTYCP